MLHFTVVISHFFGRAFVIIKAAYKTLTYKNTLKMKTTAKRSKKGRQKVECRSLCPSYFALPWTGLDPGVGLESVQE